jgi:hypothetical protein
LSKLKNCDSESGQVLLVPQALVGRYEQIKRVLRKAKQFAVLDPAPAAPLYRLALVRGEQLVDRPGDALV